MATKLLKSNSSHELINNKKNEVACVIYLLKYDVVKLKPCFFTLCRNEAGAINVDSKRYGLFVFTTSLEIARQHCGFELSLQKENVALDNDFYVMRKTKIKRGAKINEKIGGKMIAMKKNGYVHGPRTSLC